MTAPLRYPDVPRGDVSEVLHGREVADPYRYLEDPEAEWTQHFVAVQNALSEPYLADLPSRAAFLERTSATLTAPRAGVPWERGGRYFRIANPGDLDQDRLLTADSFDELLDGGRVLLDPNEWSADGTAALTSVSVSQDGTLLAYGRSDAGSDWRTVRVLDVGTGQHLPDVLNWTKWVEPTWLPDGNSLLYWRYPPQESFTSTSAMGAGELVAHRLGEPQTQDVVVWSRPQDHEWMADPWVFPDGGWLVVTAAPGTDSRSTVSARRLAIDDTGRSVLVGEEVVVAGQLEDAHRVVGGEGELLFLRTERDAPLGRLVAVDLSNPDAGWTDIASDSQRVLAGAWLAAEALVILWSVDAAHRVEILDRAGSLLVALDLGDPIAVSAIRTWHSSSQVFVGTTSFTRPSTVYRLDLTTRPVVSQQLPSLPGQPPIPVTVSGRRSGRSADGTAVPMWVLHRPDLPAGPRPTLLYGYGGFDVPVLPSFSAMFSAWVAAGGVLAVANLRGGGEFGTAWHEAGMLHAKQRVFDDLFGCAQDLIDSGVTTAKQIAVHGRSNGGLLVGAALTQRPELFAAALPTVGVLDMLRFHLFTIGWAWTTEYGSPDDPADFDALLHYSPLHRLRPGTIYPPTLICTGDHDDRVVPAHSLKFGAELQRCQAGPGPVLLRIDTRAGHGMGKPARALAAEYADQLAFAAHWTGLDH